MIYRLSTLVLVVLCCFFPFESQADHPQDPTSDTKWPYSSESSSTDIQSRFNTARTNENNQLGSSIPMMVLPPQSEWDAKNPGEKALWLINRERIDRGVAPLHGLEANVTQVAQNYAQYLLDNNQFAHDADGRNPWQRLHSNPAIGNCHDFLGVAENLAWMGSRPNGWTLPLERSVYNWMYDDSGSGWGHRHAILWYPYNDNSGPQGQEGFLGIGMVSGSFQGYPNADVVVMNIFDPCSTWSYSQSQYELSVTISGPSGGSVQSTPAGINCGQDCSHFYTPGQTITLKAGTDACVDFSGWSGGGCSGSQDCVVTIQSHTAITANFVDRDTDSDGLPDCSDPNPDSPDNDGNQTTSGNSTPQATGGSGGGGCFLGSME